jgi:glucosyl-3-phosphoglycerate phosphatase
VSGAGRARLVLVRHGETEWNADGRWQGHGGGGLSVRGREQARRTAESLMREIGDIALIARSDLRRVAETAEPLEADGAPVRVDPRLRELDCGSWAGLTHAEIAEADPERYAAWQAGADVAPGGGERVADMQARVTAALTEHLDELGDGGTAVVVTHGGPIRVGVAGLRGRSVTALDEACAPVANCSITELVSAGGAVDVVRYGDGRHLGPLASGAPGRAAL